jgi:hypothetical protein
MALPINTFNTLPIHIIILADSVNYFQNSVKEED